MLTRIYVDNYRCLVNFECRLGARQLILGANGAGKSTLFDVLSLLRDFCIYGKQPFPDDLDGPRFVGDSLTRWQDVPEQTFELDVAGNEGNYRLRLVVDSWGHPSKPRVLLEEVSFQNQPIFRFEKGEVHLFNDQHADKVQYPFDWHRSALATISERYDNTKLSWFKRWLRDLVIISPDPRQMSGIATQEIKTPDRYLSNFADWYRHIRQEIGDHEYLRDLVEVIDGFYNMRLEDAGERRREIRVQFTPKGARAEYALGELSDGQRVLIGLYAILHFALGAGATVCFDEPDNFIALREIQPWLDKIVDRMEDNASQILIISHHPEYLNRMAFKEGLLFDRPGGRHTRVQSFDDIAMTGLSAAELIARGGESE